MLFNDIQKFKRLFKKAGIVIQDYYKGKEYDEIKVHDIASPEFLCFAFDKRGNFKGVHREITF